MRTKTNLIGLLILLVLGLQVVGLQAQSQHVVLDTAITIGGVPLLVAIVGDLGHEGDSPFQMATLTVLPSHGSATVSLESQQIAYTAHDGYEGFDVFAYSVSSVAGASHTVVVAVTISGYRGAVSALGDEAMTEARSPVVIDVLRNDFSNPLIDPDVYLRVSDVFAPSHGVAEITQDMRILYTPDPGFCGTDVFTYKTRDQHEWPDAAAVHVSVMCPENHGPRACEDTALTSVGAAVVLDVLANDTDEDGDGLTISSVTQPAHPSISVRIAGDVLIYTPPVGWTGTVSFTYTVNDGRGGTDTTIVSVDVTSSNVPQQP